MPPRQELCRNFQRGSCQYGNRCKFLHATQQSKTNPFGFGVQQQTSNPFNFSKQDDSHTRGRNDFGSKPNQFKPFENKWIRDSSGNVSGATASRQSNGQPHAANHKCDDPESCKRVIVEDFENEMPQWKLTCYGHIKDGPCDIVGDISCEELRGLAYDDAKRGLSLQSIIDREKSLVNSKLVEFQNLVHKPYMPSADATPSAQINFAGTSSDALNNSRNVSGSVSSFSQLNASPNTRFAGTPSYAFGQVSPLQNTSQPFSMFQASTMPSNTSQPFSMFQASTMPLNTSAFGNQFPHQAVESSFPFGSATPNNSVMNPNWNPFSTSSKSSQMANVPDSSMKSVSNISNISSNAIGQSNISVHENLQEENTDVDRSIWNKAEWKWKAGEIPEDEPPSSCIY
ncbi:zinc finger CCCH domain-containing protein 16 isoform X2 [Henckelia pumila]|uniref:zinc finger CCCH domain-containing protein 16 isoform X2 n=1 Tax=Henckelia pumila TaxID=405737 RepID=UPI003C6E70FF